MHGLIPRAMAGRDAGGGIRITGATQTPHPSPLPSPGPVVLFLPRAVPEEYQFNQRVREVHQPLLGYAEDPQPVVQYVQVHVVGWCPAAAAAAGCARLGWRTPSRLRGII